MSLIKCYDDETYISMCIGAEEIQKINPPKGAFPATTLNSYYLSKYGDYIFVMALEKKTKYGNNRKRIWLPRLDQLLDIFDMSKLDSEIIIDNFDDGFSIEHGITLYYGKTIEECFLRHIMDIHFGYTKFINGKWIK